MTAKTNRLIYSKLKRRMSLLACALVAAGAVLGAQVGEAEACDACNNSFMEELEGERSDSLLAQEVRKAQENHNEIGLLRERGIFATAEDGDAPVLAQNEGQGVIDAPTAVASTAGAAAPDARPTPQAFDDIFNEEEEQFLEILRRDENLPNTPPTGYAPEYAEPDKEFDIVLEEGKTYLGQGVVYDGFLTNGGIPGPTLRVNEGDVVRINITNEGTVPHGGSIHAAYTQTSAHVGQIAPGQTKSVTFRATYPGVFMYHCAPGGHAIPMHVMGGQYGMIVVEPEQTYKLEEELGHGPDLSLYLLQNELYAHGKDAVESNPTYAGFNGRPFRYVEEPIAVRPGDYVRIYYLNAGPNLLSTFHFVGIIWDYVYWQGHPEARLPGGQTVTAGPSDSFVIEFRVPPEEGAYTMLTHAVGYATRGAIGLMVADKDAETQSEILAEPTAWSEEELQDKIDNAHRTINPFGPNSDDLERPTVYGPEIDEVFVDIKGNSYADPVIEIEPGTKVTWVNQEVFAYLDGEFSGIHNAVGTDGPEQFSTGMLAHGESDSHVFTKPGTYDYICTPHPYMKGRIIVREAADSGEEEASGCSTTGGGAAAPVMLALLFLGMVGLVRRRQEEPEMG